MCRLVFMVMLFADPELRVVLDFARSEQMGKALLPVRSLLIIVLINTDSFYFPLLIAWVFCLIMYTLILCNLWRAFKGTRVRNTRLILKISLYPAVFVVTWVYAPSLSLCLDIVVVL